MVYEARGRVPEARDAFATAAVQFAGALGETHADTREPELASRDGDGGDKNRQLNMS